VVHFNDKPEEEDVPMVRVPYQDILRESANGLTVQVEFTDEHVHWLPKSQCDFSEDGVLSIPEWLAEKEGLEDLAE
jgi:hypothetical protein